MSIESIIGISTAIVTAAGAAFVVRYQVKVLIKNVNGLGAKTSGLAIELAELKGYLKGLQVAGCGSKKDQQ